MTPLFNNEPRLLLIVLVINTILALLYGLWRQIRRGDNPPDGGWLRCLVMILAPVIGICMFLFGFLYYKIFFRKPVDLEDVIFSKGRVKSYLKAEERERDFVPLEEAIAVTDKENTRTLMMEIVRRDITHSLSAISLALRSEDSEVSHYAASVLRDTLGSLRNKYQQMSCHIRKLDEELKEIEDEEDPIRTETRRQHEEELKEKLEKELSAQDGGTVAGEEGEHSDIVHEDNAQKPEAEFYREMSLQERTKKEAYEQALLARDGAPKPDESVEKKLNELVDAAEELVRSLYLLLRQDVLSPMEQHSYTEMMEKAVELLDRRHVPSAQELEALCQSWLKLGEAVRCRAWSGRFEELYPNVLEKYMVFLKLYYIEGDRDGYFDTLERLKKSGIPLNHEALEVIRTFQ